MSHSRVALILFGVLTVMPVAGTQAQHVKDNAVAPAGAPDPGDPNAAVPAVRYASAFERYRANAEVEVTSWRDRNDAVGRIGGWRVYGKEAAADAKASEPAAGNRKSDAGSAPRPAHGHKN